MSLIERVADGRTLRAAWQRVRNRRPAPGGDGVTVETFAADATAHIQSLACEVAAGSYRPLPLKRIRLKKDDASERPVVVPALRDRIIQEALLRVVAPVIDEHLADAAYAYRVGRSAQAALERVQGYLDAGHRYVLRGDVARFFETLDHEILRGLLGKALRDEHLVELVMVTLEGLVFEDMSLWENRLGAPQGLSLSPVLSNLYMVSFDRRLEREGLNMVRYADDFVVLAPTQARAETAREVVNDALREIRLVPNPDKWKLGHCDTGFVFLGFHFDKHGRGPSEGAVRALMWRLEGADADISRLGLAFPERVEAYRPIIKGWLGYFGRCPSSFNPTDGAVLAALALESTAAGRPDEARELLGNPESLLPAPIEPEVRMGLASTAEELGMFWLAMVQYATVLAHHPAYHRARQALAATIGSQEAAAAFAEQVKRLAGPDRAEARWGIVELLTEQGCFGAVRQLLEETGAAAPVVSPELPGDGPSIEVPAPERYLDLFSGSETTHAREVLTDEGRRAYVHVLEPLGPETLGQHLAGRQTLGIYLLRADSTVKLAVVDVDITRQQLLLAGHDEQRMAGLQKSALTDALRVSARLWCCGIPSYLEWSGCRGFHVWVFLDAPLPARTARRALMRVLRDCGEPAEGIKWEVFPKEDTFPVAGRPSLIKLPLGVHRASGRQAVFVRENGQPYEDQLGFLGTVQAVSPPALVELAEAGEPRVPRERGADPGVLKGFNELPRSGPVRQVLRACQPLTFLAAKAKKGGYLDHRERMTILLVLGHMGEEGRRYLHQVMSWCMNYSETVTNRFIERLTGSPVSCPRIRQRHPEITASVKCDCRFTSSRGTYPSPVLHAVGGSWRAPPKPALPDAIREADPAVQRAEVLVLKMAELRRHQAGVMASIERCETEIEQVLAAAGVDRLRLSHGTLVRSPPGSATRWTVEV